jgi:hypothetical protein
MRKIISIVGACALLWSVAGATHVGAATGFASPAFQQQWQQGEALAANFWGPLATANAGQNEPYKEAPGGTRLVQYFDKGRMELSGGAVTNGLLTSELIKGQVQTGDTTFQAKPPPAIPIAGDPDTTGPTYATLASKGKTLFDAAPQQTGNHAQAALSPTGEIATSSVAPADPATFTLYDTATKHNIPKAFADYRGKVGLQTIGYALCEPFFTTVKVAGTQRQVLVQVFERRVLTYTATNPLAFQVEMGNVGRQYYEWRYGSAFASTPDVSPSTGIVTAVPTANWAGYVVGTKNVTAVHAAWIVPAVASPPGTGYSSTWVGIGGNNTEDLIQAGTEQDVENGVPMYYAWVEALPDDTLDIAPRRLSAHPGDLFSVTITNTGGDEWSVTMENRTTKQSLTLTTTYTSCKCSAEWIEELTAVDGVPDVTLANFGTVTFTEATATIGGAVKSVGASGAGALALKQHGKVTAQPQPISADGSSFAVTFAR